MRTVLVYWSLRQTRVLQPVAYYVFAGFRWIVFIESKKVLKNGSSISYERKEGCFVTLSFKLPFDLAAFMELGYIHISEMSEKRRINRFCLSR